MWRLAYFVRHWRDDHTGQKANRWIKTADRSRRITLAQEADFVYHLLWDESRMGKCQFMTNN